MPYKNQGRYAEAEPLYQQALEMRQRLLGESHPDVASSLNNLALLEVITTNPELQQQLREALQQ